jgi:hypothetical protein
MDYNLRAVHLCHMLAVFGQSLLQNVCICRLNPLVVLLLRFHNFETKLFVKLDGTFIIHLYVPKMARLFLSFCPKLDILNMYSQKYAVEIPILLDVVQYVLYHDRTDSKPTIGIQTAQSHNVQPPHVFRSVYTGANGTDNDVIVVR